MKRPLHPETRVQGEQGGEAPDCPYEPSDVPPRAIGWAALGLFGMLGCSIALVLAVTSLMDAKPPAPFGPVALQPAPPPPRLQVDAEQDRDAIEGAATRALAGGDPNAPTRMSIDQAMQQVVHQGWPDPDQPAPTASGTARAHREMRQ